ncbi:MAG TPA: ABC transporter substrate-binding protein [Burkholderiales bacterium]|nr:ABC transporter substrate-binding protein [Burkholderiales bacterium]
MNYRVAGIALLVALALLSANAAAQRLPKIGYLVFGSIRDQPTGERKAFLDALAERGWVVGKTIDIVYRAAEYEPEFLRALCENLLQEKVDVLTTVGELSTLACQKATRSVPIVCLACGDPIFTGVAESFARPGRNATGLSLSHGELAPKRIEFLKLAAPAAERIAFLWDRSNKGSANEVQIAERAAQAAGMQSMRMVVESQTEMNRSLEQLARDPPDALYVSFAPGLILQNRTAIAQLGVEHRFAVISAWAAMTEAGGLLSYAPDTMALFHRGAYYVDRILKGAQPAELPIERADKIELVINLETARKLGITLPPDLLLRATRVIE